MAIKADIDSFVWHHRGIIPVVTTLVIPAAIEAINFGIQFYKDPSILNKKIEDFTQSLHRNFCQQENESISEYQYKLIKNVTLLAVAALGTALVIAASFYWAPTGFAIASAIIAIASIATTYEMLSALPGKIISAKNFIEDTFTQRLAEDEVSFKTRRLNGMIKIATYAGIFAVAVGGVVLAGLVGFWLSHASSPWSIYETLPYQTNLVVFLEYAALSVAHFGLAIHHLAKGNTAQAYFHFAASATGIAFPLAYLFGTGPMRLHHSFLGLAIMLLPARPLQVLGSCMCIDSSLYFFNLQDSRYDYQNALLGQLPLVVTSMASTTIIQMIFDRLLDPKSELQSDSDSPKIA